MLLTPVQVNHCLRWQTAMAVLSFTLALLMFIAGVRQLLHPWDLRHHAFFNGAHCSLCPAYSSYVACLHMTQL